MTFGRFPAMRLNKILSVSSFWLVVSLVVATLGSNTFAQTDDGRDEELEPILTIGSKAPALDIETWFSDREGEFKQTTEFEPGKIYLIDFWATWSTASHPWMVKYADLQDRYFDDGLQVIRISDEDEDSVANFLELDVRGNAETIYAEWTLGYCVTTDPDRSVYEDYMVAAEQARLPVVFIVGRTGLVEWIGNPLNMTKPLKKIIADKWDREVFRAEMLAEQLMNKMAVEVRELLQRGETEEALKLIEKLMKDAPDSKTRTEMANKRWEILLAMDGPNLVEAFKEVAKGHAGKSRELNNLAWSVVTHQQRGKKIAPDLLDVAAETSETSVELARKNDGDREIGMYLDTLGHLVFMQGDLDKALEIQTEACELNQRSDVIEYLEELEQEKARRELAEAKTDEEAKEGAKEEAPDPKAEAPEPQEPQTEEDPVAPAGVES